MDRLLDEDERGHAARRERDCPALTLAEIPADGGRLRFERQLPQEVVAQVVQEASGFRIESSVL